MSSAPACAAAVNPGAAEGESPYAARASEGRRVTPEVMRARLRGRVRQDTGAISELVQRAINRLMTVNGASSFADADVLSRMWRDAEVAARHALVMPEIGKEAYGQLLLGADAPLTIDV